jgi:hypothetical protein
MDAVGLLDREDADDAGVIERGERAGLPPEALEARGVEGDLGRQDFQVTSRSSFVSVAR